MPYPDTAKIKGILSSGKVPDWDTILNEIIRPLRMNENHGGISKITFNFFSNSHEVTCHIFSNLGWLKNHSDETTEKNGNYSVSATAGDEKSALLAAIKKIYLG